MNRGRPLAPGTQRSLDAALVLWTVAWLWMGIAVANEIRGIADLGDTVSGVGKSAISAAEAMRELPIVGGQLEAPAEELRRTGEDAVASARSARSRARRVGVVLAALFAAAVRIH